LRQWSMAIARTEIANENHIMNYKECLLLKYNRFNGVKNFNDFYIYREEDGRVLIKAKRYLFTGEQGKIALNSFEQLMDEAANDIYTRAEFAKWKSMMAGMNPEWLDGKFNDEYGAPVDLLRREKKDFWVNNALRSVKELGRIVHFPVEKLKGYYYQYADIPKHQWPKWLLDSFSRNPALDPVPNEYAENEQDIVDLAEYELVVPKHESGWSSGLNVGMNGQKSMTNFMMIDLPWYI